MASSLAVIHCWMKAFPSSAVLQLLRRLQEFPESFLPPAQQQQQHCRHHPHHHCQEVEDHGTPGDWQGTQKLIAALLSLVSSPSTSSSSPANLELRVHATLALTTLLVLSQPPANDGSGDDGDDDRRAAAAAALAHALSQTAFHPAAARGQLATPAEAPAAAAAAAEEGRCGAWSRCPGAPEEGRSGGPCGARGRLPRAALGGAASS
uniref:Uncharacterized protein LOC116950392 isoform X2 n=2 Tax=Petromyzon marinus TaxID=7757 RepID=A0AAJ7X747_PETMA|nr:uncharacterized protein LOC116950392 isoform X2 [Petromyzon marinus]